MNGALAVSCVKQLLSIVDVNFSQLYLRWPGRCEIFAHPQFPGVRFFVDGAHTPESIKYALEWWNCHQHPSDRRHQVNAVENGCSNNSCNNLGNNTNPSHYLLFSCSTDRNEKYSLLDITLQCSCVPFDKVFLVNNSSLFPFRSHKMISKDVQHVTGSTRSTFMPHASSEMEIIYIEEPANIIPTLKYYLLTPSSLFIVGSLYLVGAFYEMLDIPV